MSLINTSDIQKATKLKGICGDYIAKVVMKSLKLDKINELYHGIEEKSAQQFLNDVFENLNIKVEIPDKDYSRIPKTGPFIIIANHPYGGLDGLILLKIIQIIRPDFKIIANHLLNKIDPLSDSFLAVNPFDKRKSDVSSYSGIKKTKEHLINGGSVGIFPAGSVSTFQLKQQTIADKEWGINALKLIKKSNVPIIPIYFHGANSIMFQLLSLFHENLQTAKLPSELLNKKNKKIKIRIGKLISIEKQKEFNDYNEFGRYLRAKIYYLGKPIKVNSLFQNKNNRLSHAAPIAKPKSNEDLIIELNDLPKEDLLFKFKGFEVYCSNAKQIPKILHEIGRLRETTFRAIDEGTNKELDLDEFDLYYRHLFIWDSNANRLIGSYRIGHGPEIYHQFGKRGFYINSLFRIKDDFGVFLRHSMELGRSFIINDYQKNPYALFILWKGILYYLLKNKDLKYIIGPVSISNQYNNVSKSLMIDFIKDNYFDSDKAAFFSPRNRFRYTKSRIEKDFRFKPKDIKELEYLIEEMEPNHFKLPILLKKYLKQNAQIIGFNVDPKFNNALDGLMYLNINHVDIETIQMLAKELKDPSIIERFRNNDSEKL